METPTKIRTRLAKELEEYIDSVLIPSNSFEEVEIQIDRKYANPTIERVISNYENNGWTISRAKHSYTLFFNPKTMKETLT